MDAIGNCNQWRHLAMTNVQKRSMKTGYAGLPFGELSQCEAGCVGVLGVPSEVEHGSRTGTALAPDALRKMSQNVDSDLPVRGFDLGNLNPTGDWSHTLGQLVTQMLDRNIVPLVLGGASEVALTVLGALPDMPVVAAMPIVRQDVAVRSTNTVWLGLNNVQPAEVWDQICQRKMIWRSARQLDEGRGDCFEMCNAAILWVDISVLDLGHAAGADSLNPGGMEPETLVSVIGAMAYRWQAIVITGLAPCRDTRGMSELTAIETLNAALGNA
jgi:arginase family enzyme